MIEYTVRVYAGYTEWRLNGKLHREDGPALEHYNGYKAWYLNGELHREDGPALEFSDGTKEWYLNGIQYTKADFDAKIKEMKALTNPSCVGKIIEIDGKKYKLVEA